MTSSLSSSSSSTTTTTIDDDLYPFTSNDLLTLPQDDTMNLIATGQIVSSLSLLLSDCSDLAKKDQGKITGTSELITRVEELRIMMEEHKNMIIEQKENNMVQKALAALRKTIITCKIILKKALDCNFRRNHRYKNPIRIVINDIVLCSSKLGYSLSLSYAKSGYNHKNSNIKPGQEETLIGDKYYFGHGISQDFNKAIEAYKVS
jgi:hypothetical protein